MAIGGSLDSSLNNVVTSAGSSIPNGLSVGLNGLSFTNNKSNIPYFTPLDVYASVVLGNSDNPIYFPPKESQYGNLTPKNVNDILNNDIPQAYDSFGDPYSKEFRHRLDRGDLPINQLVDNTSDIYLTSFIETGLYDNNNIIDNEDPVSFGYDIIISYDNSPLFNGAVESFINAYSSYSEIGSRLNDYYNFSAAFFKFFKMSSPGSIGISKPPRTYYLKKISGLNNLVQTNEKCFVDYGKDVLTLTLNEDVSVNMGYMVAAYKELTWSRRNGKKMIPDNLLRFDMEIIVTECRKYNRIIKNKDNTLGQHADLTSRYRHKLYECQFIFDALSHGDDIDMSNPTISEGFDIKLNYKYSTLMFDKFLDQPTIEDDGGDMIRQHNNLDNSKVNLSDITPESSDSFSYNNGSIALNPIRYKLYNYEQYGPIPPSQLDKTDDEINSQSMIDRLINGNKVKLGRAITNRDKLLQATIDNIQGQFDINLSSIAGTIIGSLNHGFTEDGYQYNIAAYLVNKLSNNVLNVANNTLGKALSGIKKDIYNLDLYLTSNLGTNNLFKTNGKTTDIYNKKDPSDTLRHSNKGRDIYGDSTATPLVYTGSDKPLPEIGYKPSVNTGGFGVDGYEDNLAAWVKNHKPNSNQLG